MNPLISNLQSREGLQSWHSVSDFDINQLAFTPQPSRAEVIFKRNLIVQDCSCLLDPPSIFCFLTDYLNFESQTIHHDTTPVLSRFLIPNILLCILSRPQRSLTLFAQHIIVWGDEGFCWFVCLVLSGKVLCSIHEGIGKILIILQTNAFTSFLCTEGISRPCVMGTLT